MNPSSRIPVVAALVVGLFLIAFGLLRSSSNDVVPVAPSGDGSTQAIGPNDVDPDSLREKMSHASPRTTSPGQRPQTGPEVETYLEARLSYASDRAPAALARVGLWRGESGEGPSFRPARRLTELAADDEGRVRFLAPPGEPLELLARSADRGPTARLVVGSLSRGETRSVQLNLERPPAPLAFRVLDAASGEPISGAAIRSVAFDQSQLGIEDFPGTSRLVQRTDGSGTAELPGSAREARWLLVDAAGYSPTAIEAASVEGRNSLEVGLNASATLHVETVDAADKAQRDVEITLQTRLGGYPTTFTAATNARGEVTFRRLPTNVPLVPTAGKADAIPGIFDAITMAPGEERTLQLKLSPQ